MPDLESTNDLLWRHLINDHGVGVLSSLKGDPVLIHGVAHTMTLCDHIHEVVVRDERWENVYAGVVNLSSISDGVDLREFIIELEYKGNTRVFRQLVTYDHFKNLEDGEAMLSNLMWKRLIDVADKALDNDSLRPTP